MPKSTELKKVMVIGSGPIIIGQAAEFDYAGTQACQSLREEGMEVVLVNSNPATIMTDANIADRVYIEPLTPEFCARIIEKERPDGLLPTLGGQVGLNLAVQLSEQGILEKYNVRLLGTPLTAIKNAEDRDLFKKMMNEIGQPIPESVIVEDFPDAIAFGRKIGYPVIVRPAYTLGGTGGGFARDEEELKEILARAFKFSPIHQALIERSVAGWKEIEYEVMRDANNTCITVCNMENFDPVGIHTGDSIVIAPSQTLCDKEYQMLRTASLRIIRALGIEGGCNVQYALHPHSMQYYVIEVNPRVSRSSALASKATGYPIAKVAAKIAIGLHLDEIRNAVTKKTYACFEPTLDYCVVKIPRWPFDKFSDADRGLGTQMKATGEVMAIDRTFETALMKAIRSLEIGIPGLLLKGGSSLDQEELVNKLEQANDERLFIIAEALRRGMTVSEIHMRTGVDPWFLDRLLGLVRLEAELVTGGEAMVWDRLAELKALGLGDRYLSQITGMSHEQTTQKRLDLGVLPAYKMVDTCAAEFEAATPYYYSSYEQEDEATACSRDCALVLGSGPIRIGQGIEFDYCSVHAVWALREAGYEAVIINNNPETVSTDFDTADRLYFEPLTVEDVRNVIQRENPKGVIVQFGGQTAINLAGPLHRAGIAILGTQVEDIDAAEDREKFDQLVSKLEIPRPVGLTVVSAEQALALAEKVGFPMVVRPSYVLGGRAMEIVYNLKELEDYMTGAVEASPEHPVLMDRYMSGKEVEVDAIGDGETVLIPGIMEHVERAGVHSGDSIAVYPPHTLTQKEVDQIVDYTTRLTLALHIKGLINIQFVIHDGEVYVLEVNPRSSRTVPFLSKVTGVPMVQVAMSIVLGGSLKEQGYTSGLVPTPGFVAVKAPVFSFAKLNLVETSLGPEMKSTGEVMGLDRTYARALFKALLSSGLRIPLSGTILATISERDKEESVPIIRAFYDLGFDIVATQGTAAFLETNGLKVSVVNKVSEPSPNILDLMQSDRVSLVFNTLTRGKAPERDGFKIRRAAVEHSVPCLTSLDTMNALMHVLEEMARGEISGVTALQDLENA